MTAANFDIELQLLIDAIFLKYHYDFREYALASLKRRLRAAMARLACRTLSQLQDRVLHEPATFPIAARLPHRAGQRDVPGSGVLPLAPFERSCRVLRTYPSLKIWVAGCSTGEEVYSLAILLHEEGLLARTLIYATDINPQHLQKAEAGVYDIDRIAGFTEEPPAVRRTLVALGLLHGGLRPRRLRQVPEAQHRVLGPQPGDRQRLRRSPARLLPKRPDLFQPGTSGSRDRPLPGCPVPERLLGLGAKESLLFSAERDAFVDVVARRSDLPEARTGCDVWRATGDRPSCRRHRHRRVRRRRRGAFGAPALVAGATAAAGVRRPAPAARQAQPARGHLLAQVRRAGPGGGRQAAGRGGNGILRAAGLSPAAGCRGRRWPCRADEAVNYSRPSIDVLFESAGTFTATGCWRCS